MNLLIDAHALNWFLNRDVQLLEKARCAIKEAGNPKIVSKLKGLNSSQN